MDHDVCKSITKIIGKLSTSGETEVNQKGVKDLMHYAGKSAFYRELFLDEFRTILDLTVGADSGNPLPPPADAAELLKLRTLDAFQSWHGKFSTNHARLPIAYNYIKNVLKIDFGDSLKRSIEEINNAEQQRERRERLKTSQLENLLEELRDQSDDLAELTTEMKNCLNLILPKPEEFMGEAAAASGSHTSESVDLREHGFTVPSVVTIQFRPDSKPEIEVTEDNEALIETLKGLYRRARNRYRPMVKQWIESATKISDPELLDKVSKVKDELFIEMQRYEELNLISTKYRLCEEDMEMSTSSEEDDDDDDFEDVPEKEGYEEFATAPPVVPKEEPMKPSGKKSTKPSTSTNWTVARPATKDEIHDPTYGLPPQELERVVASGSTKPSTSKLDPSSSSSTSTRESVSESEDRKSKLLSIAPVRPFDVDLYHWEETNLRAPAIEVADTGVHRFWQPLDREGETIENPDGVAALRTRTIAFTGKFEPVLWSCRAPLPSGTLCPRQDRDKCPFHGKIVARDNDGNPTKAEDVARLNREKEEAERNRVPEWQDPKLLKELKAKTGLDLTIRKAKKGGKSFSEKYPNLTDVRKRDNDDPRKRLEKKIFNKSTMKRVSESLDTLQRKRFKDKFGDQFNYMS